jgi:hypothetical protein
MVTLVNNADKFVDKFNSLQEKSRYLLSMQIRADANKHARMDTGELIMSSLRASDLTQGTLVWDTPYAKRVYYTGVPSHDRNPDAELMWVHVAKDRYGKDWLVLFTNLAKKEIKA